MIRNSLECDEQIIVPFESVGMFSKRITTGMPIVHQTNIKPIVTSRNAIRFELNNRRCREVVEVTYRSNEMKQLIMNTDVIVNPA